MENAQIRAVVIAMYPGKKWKSRVAKMSDARVYAIWASKQGKPNQSNRNKEQR